MVHRRTSCRHRHSIHLHRYHARNMGYNSHRWCAKRGTHTGRASSCRLTSLRTTRPENIFGHIGRHGNQRHSHQCSLFCFVQSTRRISIRRILTHVDIDIRSRLLSVASCRLPCKIRSHNHIRRKTCHETVYLYSCTYHYYTMYHVDMVLRYRQAI